MTKNEICKLALSHIGGNIDDVDNDTSNAAVALRKWFDTTRKEFLRSHPWNFSTKRKRLKQEYASVASVTNVSSVATVSAANHLLETGERVELKDFPDSSLNNKFYVTVQNPSSFTLDDFSYSGTSYSGVGSYAQIPTFEYSYRFSAPENLLRVVSLNDTGTIYSFESGYLMADENPIELKYIADNEDYSSWSNDAINAFSFLLASYLCQELNGPDAGGGRNAELRKIYESLVVPFSKIRDSREARLKVKDQEKNSPLLNSRRVQY